MIRLGLVVLILIGPLFAQTRAAAVTLGIDVLLTEGHPAVNGKRLGLVTNPSGVNSKLVPTADLLAKDKRWKLVHLFGPEHGIRGDVAAGEKISDTTDALTGLPVTSLYGKTKAPPDEVLAKLDALVFDIQDVGSRTYTYVSTLGECLLACEAAGKPLVVLDRPNPCGGVVFEGAIRDEKWKSFIGWSAMPVSHGMTFGEVALWMKSQLAPKAVVHVVKMVGWTRSMLWEDTGLHWVPTSPHIPHALHARLYIATGMIGGITKNVNDGVGSTLPFETIATEWMDSRKVIDALVSLRLPGVEFRALTYTPNYGKFAKKPLKGFQLIITQPAAFLPLRTSIGILVTLQKIHPGLIEFEGERSLSIHWGNEKIIPMIASGASIETVERTFADGLRVFGESRKKALLYSDN